MVDSSTLDFIINVRDLLDGEALRGARLKHGTLSRVPRCAPRTHGAMPSRVSFSTILGALSQGRETRKRHGQQARAEEKN
jgi:hypothetical protein